MRTEELGPPLSEEAQKGLAALITEVVTPSRSSVTRSERDVLASVPLISVAETGPDLRLLIGMDDILFDGRPFPYPTIGPWRLDFPEDGVVTMTLSFPVGFARTPADD